MKTKTRFFAMLLAVLLVASSLGVTALAADDDDEVRIRSLSFTKSRSTMTKGTEYEFEIAIRPDDYTEGDGLEWDVSDDDVLNILEEYDYSVLVEAVGPGTATLTVRTTEAKSRKSNSVTITVPGNAQSTSQDTDGSQDTDSKSSSSQTSSSKTTTSTSTTTDSQQAVTMPRETLVNAVSTAGGNTLFYSGYNVVSAETLNAAAAAGSSAVAFDTKDGNSVTGRITIYPASASNLSGSLMLGVYSTGSKVASIQAVFDKFFQNSTRVIRCEQDNYIMTVRLAAKVGSVDASNLYFYSYNVSTNRYATLPVSDVKVDNNGYVHFNTTKGGYIIVSNGPLAVK